jgi:predicted chitinase
MLNDTQKKNAIEIINTFILNGVKNKNTIAAVLSVCYKETLLNPIEENLNYSATRIMKVWTRVNYNKAKSLEFKPIELGNYIYEDEPEGYRSKKRSLGNGKNEGFKFRGRGYNQLTGKKQYKIYGNLIKEDLINDPSLVLKTDIASKILFLYMIKNANAYKIDLNNLTFANAYDVIYCFNAGLKPTLTSNEIEKQDTTGGYIKGKKNFPYFLNFIDEAPNVEIKKKINIGFILLILGVSLIIIKNKKLKK